MRNGLDSKRAKELSTCSVTCYWRSHCLDLNGWSSGAGARMNGSGSKTEDPYDTVLLQAQVYLWGLASSQTDQGSWHRRHTSRARSLLARVRGGPSKPKSSRVRHVREQPKPHQQGCGLTRESTPGIDELTFSTRLGIISTVRLNPDRCLEPVNDTRSQNSAA
jgi:hypothetical protein